MSHPISRRDLLKGAGLLTAAAPLSALLSEAAVQNAPNLPVAIARCEAYALPTVTARLTTLFDQIGGIRRLAAGKTVTVKVNLTGSPGSSALGLPASRTYHIHPNVALALATLLDRAGAKRIRFVEGTYSPQSLEQTVHVLGWDLAALHALRAPVEFEDTRNKGQARQYNLVRVPGGGDLFPAYMLNHSYLDTDSYISLAKLKNHVTAGVTLSMKNNFGITPTALYGQHEPNENSTDARVEIFHNGRQAPAAGLPQELHPNSPRVPSYRVPRHVLDANFMRPIDLALIDGVETVSGGEGPWCDTLAVQRPHLLIAGRNALCTDSVATAVMGYDPLSPAATGPFPGDNHLLMAARRGMGVADPRRIEVVGLSIAQAHHPFGWQPAQRNT